MLNEPINLYEDTILYEDTSNLKCIINLEWFPTPKLVFEIQDNLLLGLKLREIEFKLKDGTQVKGLITNINKESKRGIIKGRIVKNNDISQNQETKKARFRIPNFKKLIGTEMKICWNGWIINIEKLENTEKIIKELKDNSGFAITHTGEIKKADNSSFEYQKANDLLEAITYYLWFATGRYTCPLFLTGFDDTNNKIWEIWESPVQMPYIAHKSWLDKFNEGNQFGKPFPGFLKLWFLNDEDNEDRKKTLQLAIRLYVEANTYLLAEPSIILSHSALELLSSSIIDQSGKSSAAGYIRELVKWAKLPTEFDSLPESNRFNNLREMIEKSEQKNDWKDIPDILAGVRNKIIHLNKKNRETLKCFNGSYNNYKRDVKDLSLWYLELCLLNYFGYNGKYANRLNPKRGNGNVDPWPLREKLIMQLEDYFLFISEDDIRIKGHRLGIDNVLFYFLEGYTPEEIRAIYPDLSLEKIYATITYYLQNRQKIDAYLLRLQNWRETRYQETLKHPSPQREKMRKIKQQRQDSVRV